MITTMSPEEEEEAWRLVCEETESSPLSETVLHETTLPCSSLEEFSDQFLRDDARYAFGKFQNDVIGDYNLEVTPWQEEEDGGFSLSQRVITYIHPVINAGPMAPPSARATKEQCLRRYGNRGICLDTRTTVMDVPVSDCFYVQDRLLVEQVAAPPTETGETDTGEADTGETGDSSETQGVLLSIRVQLQVCFIKKTMFKKIVRNTTHDEMKKFWQDYATYCNDALNGTLVEPKDTSILDAVVESLACGVEDFSEAVDEIAGFIVASTIPGYPFIENEMNSCTGITTSTTFQNSTDSNSETLPLPEGVELTYLPRIGREIMKKKTKKRKQSSIVSSSSSDAACWQLIRSALMRECLLASSEVLLEEYRCVPEWQLEKATAGVLTSYRIWGNAVVVVSSLLAEQNDNDHSKLCGKQPPERSLSLEVVLLDTASRKRLWNGVRKKNPLVWRLPVRRPVVQ